MSFTRKAKRQNKKPAGRGRRAVLGTSVNPIFQFFPLQPQHFVVKFVYNRRADVYDNINGTR